jgi:UDP-N-acetylglucosamine 2-epimerase (non-hydrolysing)
MPDPRSPLTVLTVLGTRPDAIKLAPVVAAIRRHPSDLACVLVATGQHRELLDQVLREFALAPDVDLGLMREDQQPAAVVGRALPALDEVIDRVRPDLVLVQGDTATALAGALAAFYRRVAVGHVEAGLRTPSPALPFPEELHRRLIGRIAALHFAPTEGARGALEREGVDPRAIFVTGNTVIDALRSVVGDRGGAAPERLLLVTLHRRESWGAPLAAACRAVRRLLERRADLYAVIPVHPNPRVRATVESVLAGFPRVRVAPPPPYREFVSLLARAAVVLTDSGGIQEEAAALGVPVLVARDVTERVEGVRAGAAWVVGLDPEVIERALERLLDDPASFAPDATARDLYGDGRAADRVVAAVRWWAGLSAEAPSDFRPLAGRDAVSALEAAR